LVAYRSFVVCDDGRKRVLFLVRLLLVVGEFLGEDLLGVV